jgi:phosphohistidine swiveling domain-containing protein
VKSFSIKELNAIEWDKYAVRPYPFFMWSFFMHVYHSYQKFSNYKFDYLMVYCGPFEKVFYRETSTRKKMEDYFESKVGNFEWWYGYVRRQTEAITATEDYNQKIIAEGIKIPEGKKERLALFKEFIEHNSDWAGALSSSILALPILMDWIKNEIFLPRLVKLGRESEINQLMGDISVANKRIHFIEEELDVLDLAEKKKAKDFEALLENHLDKWRLIGFASRHAIMTKDELRKRVNSIKHPAEEKNGLSEKEKKTRQKIEQIKKDLKLNAKEAKLVEVVRSILFNRSIEEIHFCHQEFIFLEFFKVIAREQGISLNQCKNMIMPEIIDVLRTGKLGPTALELDRRKQSALILFRKDDISILSGHHSEGIARELFKDLAPKKFTGTLHGQCGATGKASGKVRVIHHMAHLDSFKKGEVLVTAATNPAFVVAMKKAAAIVTDEGGITCHAAILSRELDIPCVIGTKIATHVLKDGDRLKIDATEGIVKKVKK